MSYFDELESPHQVFSEADDVNLEKTPYVGISTMRLLDIIWQLNFITEARRVEICKLVYNEFSQEVIRLAELHAKELKEYFWR